MITNTPKYKIKLQIAQTDGTWKVPQVLDDLTWTTERRATPSKLTFTVLKDGLQSFVEGAKVSLKVDDTFVFWGYVFSKQRNSDGLIHVTAYDQLRYFKAKESLIYKNGETASDIIKILAQRFNLKLGSIAETGFKLPARNEEATVFDIIYNALDITFLNDKEKNLYVLYDDYSDITLKKASDMLIPDLIINASNTQDFDYTSTIDEDVYTQIKVAYDNKDTGVREIYMVKNDTTQAQWGVLQMYHKVDDKSNAANIANIAAERFAQKKRILRIQNTKGDLRVRAGCSVMIVLDLGDVKTNKYMLCESVTHHFSADEHTMDIEVYDSGKYRVADENTGSWQGEWQRNE